MARRITIYDLTLRQKPHEVTCVIKELLRGAPFHRQLENA
jgi:hypothetical protein